MLAKHSVDRVNRCSDQIPNCLQTFNLIIPPWRVFCFQQIQHYETFCCCFAVWLSIVFSPTSVGKNLGSAAIWDSRTQVYDTIIIFFLSQKADRKVYIFLFAPIIRILYWSLVSSATSCESSRAPSPVTSSDIVVEGSSARFLRVSTLCRIPYAK